MQLLRPQLKSSSRVSMQRPCRDGNIDSNRIAPPNRTDNFRFGKVGGGCRLSPNIETQLTCRLSLVSYSVFILIIFVVSRVFFRVLSKTTRHKRPQNPQQCILIQPLPDYGLCNLKDLNRSPVNKHCELVCHHIIMFHPLMQKASVSCSSMPRATTPRFIPLCIALCYRTTFFLVYLLLFTIILSFYGVTNAFVPLLPLRT